jgi:hypothetical protein
MTKIYREKWSADACYGEHVDEEGNLSPTAKDWQKFLAGLTDQQIKTGIHVMIKKAEAWPPNVMEFKTFCMSLDQDRETQKQIIKHEQITHEELIYRRSWKKGNPETANKFLSELKKSLNPRYSQ